MRNGTERPTDVASRCGAPPPCAALFAPAGMLLVVALGIAPLLLSSSSAGSVVHASEPDPARVLHFRGGELLAPDATTPDAATPAVMTQAADSGGAILKVGHASILPLPSPAPAAHPATALVSRRGPSPREIARTKSTGPAARPAGGGAATVRQQLAWPVRGPVTSPFGWRTHPIFGTHEFHTGIDIAAPLGTPVVSAYAGTVRFVGWQNGYGRLIIVYHGGGLETAYSHLAAASVQPGQHVAQGEEVGRVGSTGWSTGPHLLFEVFQSAVPQNPSGYLP